MEFTLREWLHEDAQSLAKYADNIKIASNLRNGFPYPYTLPDAQNFISACQNSDRAQKCFRAITIGNEAAGSIGVFRKDDIYCKSAEIGYWLGEPFWGNGIVSCAITQICEIVFSQWDIVRIDAEPFAYNIGSRRALEKAGFLMEGYLNKSVYKNGKIYDSCVFAKIRD